MFSCVDTSIVSTALVNISSPNELDDYLNAPWAVLAYLLTYMSESHSSNLRVHDIPVKD
jgi:hypothetical protein